MSVVDLSYRGWIIGLNYIGEFEATGPDYDASYEGPEDGWVDNGQHLTAATLHGLHCEVDAWFEDNGLNGERADD